MARLCQWPSPPGGVSPGKQLEQSEPTSIGVLQFRGADGGVLLWMTLACEPGGLWVKGLDGLILVGMLTAP